MSTSTTSTTTRVYVGPIRSGKVQLPGRTLRFERGVPLEVTAEEAGLLVDDDWVTEADAGPDPLDIHTWFDAEALAEVPAKVGDVKTWVGGDIGRAWRAEWVELQRPDADQRSSLLEFVDSLLAPLTAPDAVSVGELGDAIRQARAASTSQEG